MKILSDDIITKEEFLMLKLKVNKQHDLMVACFIFSLGAFIVSIIHAILH